MSQLIIDRARIQTVFKNYTDSFDSLNPKIRLKIDHTYYVAQLCDKIAHSIGLTDWECSFAWALGIFHDLGRFEQIHRYNTFSDADSEDHAYLSVKILFQDKLLNLFFSELQVDRSCQEYMQDVFNERKFMIDVEKKDRLAYMHIIKSAVFVHSGFSVPSDLQRYERMFCDILRDADKIDIIRMNADISIEILYGLSETELQYSSITKEVFEKYMEEQEVPRALLETVIDRIIGQASMVFGLVYPESMKIIKERGDVFRMFGFAALNREDKELFDHIIIKLKQYVDHRISCTRSSYT